MLGIYGSSIDIKVRICESNSFTKSPLLLLLLPQMEEFLPPTSSSEVIVVSMEDCNTVSMIDPRTHRVIEGYSDEASELSSGTMSIAANTGHIIGSTN